MQNCSKTFPEFPMEPTLICQGAFVGLHNGLQMDPQGLLWECLVSFDPNYVNGLTMRYNKMFGVVVVRLCSHRALQSSFFVLGYSLRL